MWVFLSDAFLSIVAHRDQPDDLMVRARLPGDIERAFPGRVAEHTPRADYPYRAIIPRAIVAKVLSDAATEIEYDNFKGSVPDPARHDAYFEVWRAMRRLT